MLVISNKTVHKTNLLIFPCAKQLSNQYCWVFWIIYEEKKVSLYNGDKQTILFYEASLIDVQTQTTIIDTFLKQKVNSLFLHL